MTRSQLYARLKALAWQAIAELEEPLSRPLQARCRTRRHEVAIQAGPVGKLASSPPEAFPGLHFSAIEAAIWHALAGGEGLLGKQIARATGQSYTPRLKALLQNLVDRQVIEHGREGYRRRGGKEQSRERA